MSWRFQKCFSCGLWCNTAVILVLILGGVRRHLSSNPRRRFASCMVLVTRCFAAKVSEPLSGQNVDALLVVGVVIEHVGS